MAINYRRLWKLLIDLDLNKTDLREKAKLSSATVAKLSQNKVVQSDVLDRICIALNCNIEDIMEVEHDTDYANNAILKNEANGDISKYSIVSLFSGCGGLDLGFKGGFDFLGSHYDSHPFEVIWANEINAAACRTYSANVDSNIVEGPIEETYKSMPAYADIVLGGFPCQDISINGKMAGVDGARSGLYVWMVKAVRDLRPKVFIAENVKALLMKRHESSLNRVINDFSELGYKTTYHLYDAADYGVPQNRERVIIVGVRKDIDAEFVPPIPVTAQCPITAREALLDLENVPENKKINHIWSAAKPSSGQGLRFLTADAPATTMRSECHGNIQFHYALPRRISMREAARIQSFPDNFIFQAKIRETERMIGNAVPPVLAWHVASSILNVLEGSNDEVVK